MENHIEESKIQNKNPYPSLQQTFGILGIFVLISIVVSLPAAVLLESFKNLKPLIICLSYLVSTGLVLLVAIKLRGNAQFDWKKPAFEVYLYLVPAVITLIILVEPLTNAIPVPDMVKEYFRNLITKDFYSFITVAILAPLLEELIFRGIILKGLLKRYPLAIAIFWSSLVFGIAHLNPWQFIGAFLIGHLIGWVYWKSNSLIPGMFIHFTNNLFGFLMILFLDDSFTTTQQIIGNNKLYYTIYGMCIPIFIFCIVQLAKIFKKKEVIKQNEPAIS